MNVQFTSQLHRFHLILILTLTLTTAITASSAFGERFDASNDIIPIHSDNTITAKQVVDKQLYDWISLGTHDSRPLPTLAPPPLISKARMQQDSKPSLAPHVSVKEVIEPFAAVGPCLTNSLKSVQILQHWWDPAANAPPKQSENSSNQLEMQLQELATQEPVDVDSLGPSVLIPARPKRKLPTIEVARIDPLIGSSPVIATIEEDYMPYDLSARDLRLWSVFPIASHPFCVRGQVEHNRSARLWDDFDTAMAKAKPSNHGESGNLAVDSNDATDSSIESPASPSDLTRNSLEPLVANDSQPNADVDKKASLQGAPAVITAQDALVTLEIPATVAPQQIPTTPGQDIEPVPTASAVQKQLFDGSADRLLEELVWKAETLAALNSVRDGSKFSASIGILIASYTQTARQWLSDRAFRITSRWPKLEQKRDPSRSGAKLLARAGLLESGIIEDNAMAGYEPIERLDGIDCGSQPTLQVATTKDKAKSR